MPYNIDLKELSQRESEKVEWKENGEDKHIVASIVKTISAFANDIANFGGGYVVCGAKEIKDEYGFPKLKFSGLTADKLKEIEGKALQHCRDYVSPSIAPIVQELKNPSDETTRILVFIIIADSQAHTYRDGETSNYYVRIGRETRVAKNGIFRQLMESKQQIVPFDKRPNPNTCETDIEPLFFKDCMIEMELLQPNKQLEDYFSDNEQIAEFIPPLFAKKSLDSGLCLRNFALLMFGKKKSITFNFTEAYTILSVYYGVDRSEPSGKQYTLTGSIIEQAKKTIDLLETQTHIIFDKTSDKPNKEIFPKRALQEAVINAIVHRDYQIGEPIRITVFSDRIEIRSPGTLHWGIDREEFKSGKASPKWRNQSLAYLFTKLKLAQAEGQGISTIIRTMREEGCPDPVFVIEEENVTCILPARVQGKVDKDGRRLRELESDQIERICV